MANRILYESHLHTPLCKHAKGEPGDYAAVAAKRGLAGITVTCHNPMPDGYSAGVRMAEAEFPQYVAMIRAAAAAWAGTVDVRMGIECDYAPEFAGHLEKQVASAPFSHVLGSVHPQVKEYQARYFRGDPVAFQRLYFEHLAMAAETGLFDTLSHPDLVKNNDKAAWQLERVMGDIRRALDRIAKAGTAMELNTSGLSKAVPEMNPGPVMLREMAARNIPVVLGADAHVPERVADRYEEALDLLAAAGYREVSFFVDRQRRTVPIPAARASLIAS